MTCPACRNLMCNVDESYKCPSCRGQFFVASQLQPQDEPMSWGYVHKYRRAMRDEAAMARTYAKHIKPYLVD